MEINIKKETILIATVALLVGAVGGYCVGHTKGEWRSGYLHDRFDKNEQFEANHFGKEYDHMGMMRGGGDNDLYGMHMGMMVSSEKEFLTEMIPHHQEAVDTAKITLERGATTPEIRALLEGIITTQEKEIAEMKQWYQTWYGEEYKNTGEYHEMMRDLENLSGEDIDRAFLGDMIRHHMGAIMMARSVTPYIEHDEIKTLTTNILDTQSREITEMQQMLQGL